MIVITQNNRLPSLVLVKLIHSSIDEMGCFDFGNTEYLESTEHAEGKGGGSVCDMQSSC